MTYRENEFRYLEDSYNKRQNEIVIMYGQKYVGKQELLNQYLKDKSCITLTAVDATERQQRYLWGRYLVEIGYQMPDYPSFIAIFSELIRKIQDKKMILCITDFEKTVKLCPDFLNALVSISKENSPLQILLISSAISWVENTMVSKIGKNALEVHGFLKIRPLPYIALKEYFYNHSSEECLQIYAILGGYPGLWQYFDDRLSVRENIIKNLLPVNSFLYNASYGILSMELRELNVYATILAGLAEGKNKLNHLHEYTQFSRPKISVYLKNLMELEVVEKVFSIDTAGRDQALKGIYDIQIPLIKFFFSFLYGRQPNHGEEENFYTLHIQPALRLFTEDAFERVCMQYIQMRNLQDKLAFRYDRIGKWVGKAGTIPVVAEGESGRFMVAFSAYDKPIMTYLNYEWLAYLTKQAKIQPEFIYLFADHGFEEKILLEARVKSNIKTVVLDDIR